MRSIVRFAPLAMVLTLAGSARAEAKPARPVKGAVRPKALDKKAVKAIQEQLAGKPEDVRRALQAVIVAGPAAAAVAPDVEAILRRGVSFELTALAIKALGVLGAPTSAAVVAPYMGYRHVIVYVLAAEALGKLGGPVAEKALRAGLRSMDPSLRSASARSLGEMGAKAAVPDLLRLADAGDDNLNVLAAIGQLCEGGECKRLMEWLGKVQFVLMKDALEPIFFREPPLPDAALLDVVAALRELGTADTRRYLTSIAERWPKSGSQRVKQAIEDMLSSIPLPLRRDP